jgi:hypothetical protein
VPVGWLPDRAPDFYACAWSSLSTKLVAHSGEQQFLRAGDGRPALLANCPRQAAPGASLSVLTWRTQVRCSPPLALLLSRSLALSLSRSLALSLSCSLALSLPTNLTLNPTARTCVTLLVMIDGVHRRRRFGYVSCTAEAGTPRCAAQIRQA